MVQYLHQPYLKYSYCCLQMTFFFLLSETATGLQNQLNILYRSSERLQLKSESKIPPVGIRILPHLEKSKINLNLIDDASSLDITPWTRSNATVRLDLSKMQKMQTNKQTKNKTKNKHTSNLKTYKQYYLQLITEFPFFSECVKCHFGS